MACCLLLCDDSPVQSQHRNSSYGRFSMDPSRFEQFRLPTIETITKAQPTCCFACLCAPCYAYYTRVTVLGDSWPYNYSCCQGYYCCAAGPLEIFRQCPQVGLCLESCICLGPSVSASRIYMMDKYALKADPCDNRLIRCENCLMSLYWILECLECFFPRLRECDHIFSEIMNCTYHTMIGMMMAQTLNEVQARDSLGDQIASAPYPYGYGNVPTQHAYPQQQHHHHNKRFENNGYADYGALPVAEVYPAQQQHRHHHREGGNFNAY